MDTTAIAILGLLVLAVVVIFFSVFRRSNTRQRAKTKLKGPLGTEFQAEASNDPATPAPGVRAKGIISREASVVVVDEGGQRVDAENIDARQDVRLTNKPPQFPQDPKKH